MPKKCDVSLLVKKKKQLKKKMNKKRSFLVEIIFVFSFLKNYFFNLIGYTVVVYSFYIFVLFWVLKF